VQHLVYTHFVAGRVDKEASLALVEKNFQGNVIFAEDGMVLTHLGIKARLFAESGPDTPEPRAGNTPLAVVDTVSPNPGHADAYPVVDTGQTGFYDEQGEMDRPETGQRFYGQDGHYAGAQPGYGNNGDGTITDRVTVLMLQQDYKVLSYRQAIEYANSAGLAGHDDWRVPSIKEVYSIALFSGVDASQRDMNSVPDGARPFIDTRFFAFDYGANGDRVIDTQLLSSTLYRGKTMGRTESVFGFNLADGRIKAYPLSQPRSGQDKVFTVRLVRGSPDYGKNHFQATDNKTVIDQASGLMWSEMDSGVAMNWQQALAWAARMNEEEYLGYNDWRLPDAKQLQSILDYSRSPQSTNSPAISPLFSTSTIRDEGGKENYPCYWSSTTHLNLRPGRSAAVYICFGEALGYMKRPGGGGTARLVDVHGSGAQRADWKTGDPGDYPRGHGPQGDVVRMAHHVRLVRVVKQ
jgi:hypothetical protein